MASGKKFDEETKARVMRLYLERRADIPAESAAASRRHVSELVSIEQSMRRIYGRAVSWTHSYGLIEWLDSSGKYHMGWAHASSIKRVKPEDWQGSGGL